MCVCWELGNIIILPILDIMSESTTYPLHVNSASSVTVYLNPPFFFLIVSLPLLLLWLPKRIACVSLNQGSRLLSRIQLYLFRKFIENSRKLSLKKYFFSFWKIVHFLILCVLLLWGFVYWIRIFALLLKLVGFLIFIGNGFLKNLLLMYFLMMTLYHFFITWSFVRVVFTLAEGCIYHCKFFEAWFYYLVKWAIFVLTF